MTKFKVFLSHATEDKPIAKIIAEKLHASEIECWYDEWEINIGDSIRQKIDNGIDNCTHFVVLFTDTSIKKPWVKEEIDAGFIKYIEGKAKFFPLRYKIEINTLPSLLQGKLSPEISDDKIDENINQLISDIKGISKKPPVKKLENISQNNNNYSEAANKIAEYFCTNSQSTGREFDIMITIEELSKEINISINDTIDAFYELEKDGLIKISQTIERELKNTTIFPTDQLYLEFISVFKEFSPKEDALKIAIDYENNVLPNEINDILTQYEWKLQRLNIALNYLLQENIIRDSSAIGQACVVFRIMEKENGAFRRFIKNNS